ncbi:hypothetical protein BC828DRAFT_103252 [Blastocladiella britannica]|nr:hypothetical protein BC828DRAFT_103252 [Blastocladiella britannica]
MLLSSIPVQSFIQLRPDPAKTDPVQSKGGGTVDLAAYSVDRVPGTTKMSFTELSQGTGGVYGSMILDGIFEVYLESVIGKEHWHLVRSNVAVWTRVLDQWNLVKTSFSGDMSMDAVEIELPRAAFTALGATRSDSVRGALRKHNGANIRDIRGDGEDSDDDDDEEEEEEVEHLLLTSVIIKKLFDQVVDGIIKLTMDVIADCAAKGADKAITKVLCVGGFSDNQYLVKRVRAAVQVAYPGIHVLVPALPSQAVLIGAVLYGVDPGTFKSRILRHTYGFGTLFQARDPHWNGVDTSALPKYEKPGMFGFATVYHKGFESMAKINDSVEADETKSTVVLPFSPEQEQVAVEIYMSSDREPKLITGTGCRHLGTISLPVDRSKGTDQQFEVQFKFGMTEIKTQFKNVATGEVQDVSLKYL